MSMPLSMIRICRFKSVPLCPILNRRVPLQWDGLKALKNKALRGVKMAVSHVSHFFQHITIYRDIYILCV